MTTEQTETEQMIESNMAAIFMLCVVEMESPGSAVQMITDDRSPYRAADTIVLIAAVRSVLAVCDMGDVTADDLTLFMKAVRGDA